MLPRPSREAAMPERRAEESRASPDQHCRRVLVTVTVLARLLVRRPRPGARSGAQSRDSSPDRREPHLGVRVAYRWAPSARRGYSTVAGLRVSLLSDAARLPLLRRPATGADGFLLRSARNTSLTAAFCPTDVHRGISPHGVSVC